MRRTLLLAISLAVLAGAGMVAWTALRTASPRIVVKQASVDFGPIASRTERTVQVRNVGRVPLVITAISSSCGCTTARIEKQELAPGKGAVLTITFDVEAHGPQTGPAQHAVYLRTNDPDRPEVEIEVRAVVLEESKR